MQALRLKRKIACLELWVTSCKELVFWYMFSLHVFSFWQFWWIFLGYIKTRFWPVLADNLLGHVWIRKDYIGIMLVVFWSYFIIITCHIPISFWISFMFVSLLTTISCYACLMG